MRQSLIDKAIEALEQDKHVLDLAIAKLKAQKALASKDELPDVSRMPLGRKRPRRANGPEKDPVTEN